MGRRGAEGVSKENWVLRGGLAQTGRETLHVCSGAPIRVVMTEKGVSHLVLSFWGLLLRDNQFSNIPLQVQG